MVDAAQARFNMVENQLRPSRISDERLLAAMGSIPREAFVPEALKGAAYGDEDLSLGDGRWLIEPLGLAKLVQAAGLRIQDRALVIGCDTGYAGAIMATLCGGVTILAPDQAAADAMLANLAGLGLPRVEVVVGPPSQGSAARAPFGAIVIAGAVEEVPEALLEQLADGGRLATVTLAGRAGRLALFTRVGRSIGRTTPMDVTLPVLAAFRRPASFAL